MNNLIEKIKALFYEIKNHWKKPKEGEYVSYKELSYFVLGVSGNNSFTNLSGYILFAASCLLVGAIYKIEFEHFYLIGLLSMPFGLLFTPINILVQDNLGNLPKKSSKLVHTICIITGIIGISCYFIPQSRFERFMPALPQILGTILTSCVFNVYFKIFTYKKLYKHFGKFRSWIVIGVVPTLIFYALLVYLPFDKTEAMPYYTKLWIVHLLFTYYNIFNVFSTQVVNIQNVISPSTEERTKILAYGSFLYSLAPSIVGIILPVFASLAGGFDKIEVYRIVFPPFLIICGGATLILAFKVKDRVVISEEHKPQIGMLQGTKMVLKNKYFWLTNTSVLLNCIVGGSVAVINIFFIYTTRQDFLLGIYAAVVGTSCIPGMLLAPWLIRKFGKKNLVIFSKFSGLISLIGSVVAIRMQNTILFIFVNYVNTLLTSPTTIAATAMTPDIWDYQQYLTGERLDGFSGMFGLIFTPISVSAAYLIPYLYGQIGFSSDWGLMYFPDIRDKVVYTTAIVGAVASIASAIPYFFYDLTEEKHKNIIKILQERLDEKNAKAEEITIAENSEPSI